MNDKASILEIFNRRKESVEKFFDNLVQRIYEEKDCTNYANDAIYLQCRLELLTETIKEIKSSSIPELEYVGESHRLLQKSLAEREIYQFGCDYNRYKYSCYRDAEQEILELYNCYLSREF